MRFVYTHMGLGDHIIFCGLLNELRKREPIATFVKPHNYPAVAAMLDPTKIPLIVCVEDLVADFATTGPVSVIGHMWWDHTEPFDKSCYKQAQVDFKHRWDSFTVLRNKANEAHVCHDLQPAGPYVFVHDDADRGYPIDPARLPNLPVVRPRRDVGNHVFDYLSLMEGADEIHVIESAFAAMADSFDFWTQPMVLHRYARPHDSTDQPSHRLPWKILE